MKDEKEVITNHYMMSNIGIFIEPLWIQESRFNMKCIKEQYEQRPKDISDGKFVDFSFLSTETNVAILSAYNDVKKKQKPTTNAAYIKARRSPSRIGTLIGKIFK